MDDRTSMLLDMLEAALTGRPPRMPKPEEKPKPPRRQWREGHPWAKPKPRTEAMPVAAMKVLTRGG